MCFIAPRLQDSQQWWEQSYIKSNEGEQREVLREKYPETLEMGSGGESKLVQLVYI